MCGIVGALSRTPVDPGVIEGMRDRLAHRGPDHGGIWHSSNGRVCLAHRRLAILDLSPEANQPFISHDGRYVITFNGEIYNHVLLRQELEATGARFRTRSDTEVLVEAFRVWGTSCVNYFSGMFAFAIWDTQHQFLFCARDRAGEKPFYYTIQDGTFLFASELKAILAWPGFRRNIHYPALVDFLTFGYVPDPKTIWEDCWKLPPGCYLRVDTTRGFEPTVGACLPYWDMEFVPDHAVDNWEHQVRDTLEHSAREMSFADVPVGTFLSGGVDSSSVTAALTHAGSSVSTFTVGFNEPGYDERAWARTVAKLCGSHHTETLVRPEDITSVFDRLLWHYDEPFNDYSYFPTFYVCREARKSVTVALSGDGGDELFGGYTKYSRLSLRQSLDRLLPARFTRTWLKFAARILPHQSDSRRLAEWYGAGAADALTDMLSLVFQPNILGQIARGPLADAARHYSPLDCVTALLTKARPRDVGWINSMRYLDLKLTLAGDILTKVDRASMAVSLEVRPVYLHPSMLALAAKLPPQLLADSHRPKKLLKKSLEPWLPHKLLYRKKMGFALPLGAWIKAGTGLPDVRSCGALTEILDEKRLQMLCRNQSQSSQATAVTHSINFLSHWWNRWVLETTAASEQGFSPLVVGHA